MQMPWQTFIQTLVDEMDAAGFVVGHDFCFGWKGEGTAESSLPTAPSVGSAAMSFPP